MNKLTKIRETAKRMHYGAGHDAILFLLDELDRRDQDSISKAKLIKRLESIVQMGEIGLSDTVEDIYDLITEIQSGTFDIGGDTDG